MDETRKSASSLFAIIIGLFLMVEGLWGLTSDVVFGGLTTNRTHAIIHIVLGVIGILAGWKNRARGFCIFLGILLLAVGVLRFVPGVSDLIVQLLNVNNAVAWLNIVVGAVALLVAFVPGEDRLRRNREVATR
ncbi:MAG: DUF4383 domain-containing protein [Chthoniobacterales bacterium]|nr:DUF4383 domain-containing protein [Chthoniobacterales bacterium]MBA3763053.1 DUF4383 domain-containing protein [Chthoniobacterales bacterium]